MSLLDLPTEILLHILRLIPDFARAAEEYHVSLLRKSYYKALLPLSVVNAALRRICIESGLFTRVKPTCSLAIDGCGGQTPSTGSGLPRFLSPISKYGPHRIKALVVDLTNPDVWVYCRRILDLFCDLKELGLCGLFNKVLSKDEVAHFLDSEAGLAEQIKRSPGTTLSLKNMHMCVRSWDIFNYLPRSNINTIYLESSSLDLTDEEVGVLKRVGIFPSLRRISFIGNDLGNFPFPSGRQDNLIQVFTAQAPLTHLQVSSGYRLGFHLDTGRKWFPCLDSLINFVGTFAADTLEMYLETDELNHLYLTRRLSAVMPTPQARFRNLCLVGLRCRDAIKVLGPQTRDPFSEAKDIYRLPEIMSTLLSYRPWEYLEALVARFEGTESILIETPIGSVDADRQLQWALFATEMASRIGHRQQAARTVSHLIIGNETGRYWGLKRLGEVPMEGFE
jgi:hypothetical protein